MRFVHRLTTIAAAAFWALPVEAAPSQAAVVPVTDAQIAAFEGTWAGPENPTPFGPIGFAMDFRREEDGSLRSHSALSRDTWVDLHFHKDTAGLWVLTEAAALRGTGQQSYTIHPVHAAADTIEWAYLPDPHFLTVRTAAREDELYMLVFLRGEQHVLFRLARLEGDSATNVRRELETARDRPGDEDLSRLQQAGGDDDPREVLNARATAQATPQDPAAHLALAEAIATIIEAAPPAKLPLYATEMLRAYERAVELDPASVRAHFGLAQYYVNAPSIAGGSLEKARSEAATLARLGSPLAEVVLAQVESLRGDPQAAIDRMRAVIEAHPELEEARRLLFRLSSAADGSTSPR